MIRVLVADDHGIVREGVRRLLADTPDLRVTVEAASGAEALAGLAREPVDVAVVDVVMPRTVFADLLKDMRERHAQVRIIAFSAYGEEEYAVRALRGGAAGYIPKERSAEELVQAIRTVAAGHHYVSPTLAQLLAAEAAGRPHGTTPGQLSDREFEVLRLLGSGLSVKEVAARLALSAKTVSTYRTRLLRKLALRTTADLIRYVVEHGIR